MLSIVRSFDLVLLEEDEFYVSDSACNILSMFPSEVSQSNWTEFLELLSDASCMQNPAIKRGRIRVGTKSLIFEPDALDLPIFKLHFQHVTCIYECMNVENGLFVSCRQVTCIPSAIYNGKTRFVSAYDVHVVGSNSGGSNNESTYFKGKIELPCFCFVIVLANATIQKQQLRECRKLWDSFKSNLFLDYSSIVSNGFSNALIPNREKLLLGTKSASEPGDLFCWRLKRMVRHGGFFALTDRALYFQPCPNFSRKPCKRIPLDSILHIFRRDSGLFHNGTCVSALEIISLPSHINPNDAGEVTTGVGTNRKTYRCLYLEFRREFDREQITTALKGLIPRVFFALESRTFRQEMTMLWRRGILPNFQYLDFLNCIAGRSRYDLSHYPIFPWVISDYTSASLNLENPNIYRDLCKPVGALNPERLELLKGRMSSLKITENDSASKLSVATAKSCECGGIESNTTCNKCLVDAWNRGYYLYGCHYSTPALVVFFLIRCLPECQLRLYGGKFDVAARTFKNVAETFSNAMVGTSTFFELIPEFYEGSDAFLRNCLNITTQDGRLGDVELPPWANNSSSQFLKIMRAALESDFVSRNLPNWIDLIFGYKQAGPESLRYDNVFHPLSYLSSVHAGKLQPSKAIQTLLKTMDPKAIAVQVGEFGQAPIMLFDTPHPEKIRSGVWKPSAGSSAPWFIYLEQHAHVLAYTNVTSAASRLSRTISNVAASDTLHPLLNLDKEPNIHHRRRLLDPQGATATTAGFCHTDVAYATTSDGKIILNHLQGDSNTAESASRLSLEVAGDGLTSSSVLGNSSGTLVVGSASGTLAFCNLANIYNFCKDSDGDDDVAVVINGDVGTHVVRMPQVHYDAITSLDYHDGVLTSGSVDETVQQYSIRQGQCRLVGSYSDFQSPVTNVCYMHGLILSATQDGTLYIHDTRSPPTPIWNHQLDASANILQCYMSSRYIQVVTGSGDVSTSVPILFWDVRMLNSLTATSGFKRQVTMPPVYPRAAACNQSDVVAICTSLDVSESSTTSTKLWLVDLANGPSGEAWHVNVGLKDPKFVAVDEKFNSDHCLYVVNGQGDSIALMGASARA